MAVQNISTLTDNNLSKLANEFNYYALANLGQRMGVRGDGVTINAFDFISLISNSNYSEEFIAKNIGVIILDNIHNKITLNIVDKNTKLQVDNSFACSIENIHEYITTTEKIRLNSVINNVDYYKEQAIIGYNSNKHLYYYSAYGMYDEPTNSKTTTPKIEEYNLANIYEDNNSSEVLSYLKVVLLPYSNTQNKLKLCKLSDYYDSNNKNEVVWLPTFLDLRKTDNGYILTIINISEETCKKYGDTYQAYTNITKDLVNNYITRNDMSNMCELLNSYYVNNSIDVLNPVARINLDFSTEANQYFSVSIDNNSYIEELNNTGTLDEYVEHFNKDITYVFPAFKETYSVTKYSADEHNIKAQILASLATQIATDANRTENLVKIYIPLTYTFTYIVSIDKAENIYESVQPISVQHIGAESLSKLALNETDIDFSEINSITLITASTNKMLWYNFTCYYNNDNLLYNIDSHNYYTLPYINSNFYWMVDGMETGVYARGKDAGQPNIIFIYNEYTGKTDSNGKPIPHAKLLWSATHNDYPAIFNELDDMVQKTKTFGLSYDRTLNIIKKEQDTILTNSNTAQVYDDSETITTETIKDKLTYQLKYLNNVWENNENSELTNTYLSNLTDTISNEFAELHKLIETYHFVSDVNEPTQEDKYESEEVSYINAPYIVYTNLPDLHKLSEEVKQLISNSIIINITNVQNSEVSEEYAKYTDTLVDIYGKSGIVTTFWVVDNETAEYVCLKNPNNENIALDFNYLGMIDEYIRYAMKTSSHNDPDNYGFTQLIFDNILLYTKNSIKFDNVASYVKSYPSIRNINVNDKITNYYNDAFTENKYFNNANLAIEFVSYIYGELATESSADNEYAKNSAVVNGVGKSDELAYYSHISDGKYIPRLYNSELTSNSYVINYTNTEEYTFNGILPTLELKEIVLRNANVLNRTNIVSLDRDANILYSYIGTHPYDYKKSTLHFGTGNTNISWGTNTLSETNNEFKSHDKLSIEFNKIELNGNIWNHAIHDKLHKWKTDYNIQVSNYVDYTTDKISKYNHQMFKYVISLNDLHEICDNCEMHQIKTTSDEIITFLPVTKIIKEFTEFTGIQLSNITVYTNINTIDNITSDKSVFIITSKSIHEPINLTVRISYTNTNNVTITVNRDDIVWQPFGLIYIAT